MKKILLIMVLLVISLPFASADSTNMNVSVTTAEDARVGVDCRASGTCLYDINGEPFDSLDERWSKDTSGMDRDDATKLIVGSIGCILGRERFLGEKSRCDDNYYGRLTYAFDSLIRHYVGFIYQRQEQSLYRQDRIMARQEMLMESLNQSFDPHEVEMRTARISYNRVGGEIRTESGYTCDVKNDRFVCIKELEE